MKLNEYRIATILSCIVFVGALVLTFTVSPYFIILAAVAGFAPDILRLTGIIFDVDEFQQQAAGNASRIAVVVATLSVGVFYALTSRGVIDPALQKDAWLIVFTLLIATRYISYATMFWDARRGAPRIFIAFGAFWLVFVVLSNWGSWIALLIEAIAVAGPFTLGALYARKYPRIVGIAAMVVAVSAFFFFDLYELFLGNIGSLIVFALIPMPLLVTGISLSARTLKNQYGESNDEK